MCRVLESGESSSVRWTNGTINLQRADLIYGLADTLLQKLAKIVKQRAVVGR